MWLFPDGTWSATWAATAIGVLHGDSDPNHGAFQVWFAAFPDDEAGAAYYLGIANRSTLAALRADASLSAFNFATDLYLGCYYGGVHSGARACGSRKAPFNAAELANIGDYSNALTSQLPGIVTGLAGWTPPGGGTIPAPPLPVEVPTADEVKALQAALNGCGATPPLVVDGLLGPLTRAACGVIAKG
jgi:hypothetical protein